MKSPTTGELGIAIRLLRTERETTLETLAKGAEIHWTYLSGIERGRRNPTWKVLARIAETLDVSVSEMVGRAEAVAREARGSGADGSSP